MFLQVERGETSPSLAVLARIAASFDLTLSQLLDPTIQSGDSRAPPDRLMDPLGAGPQIRALRERKDLSLRGLSERSGVSIPMLSRVERDETSPTLTVFARIAVGLDLSMSQLLSSDAALPSLDLRVCEVSDELIGLLSSRPELLYALHPRRLEELLAELYARQGFDVELTQQTHDEGVDLYLVRHTSFGRLLTLVDTKRHRSDRPVGVGVVRQLYGVVEAKNASAGVVATTSFFSRDARRFQERVPFRLGLQDYRDLQIMLRQAVRPDHSP
jgi:transcriptional regulator with XRE-family HTH domain